MLTDKIDNNHKATRRKFLFMSKVSDPNKVQSESCVKTDFMVAIQQKLSNLE